MSDLEHRIGPALRQALGGEKAPPGLWQKIQAGLPRPGRTAGTPSVSYTSAPTEDASGGIGSAPAYHWSAYLAWYHRLRRPSMATVVAVALLVALAPDVVRRLPIAPPPAPETVPERSVPAVTGTAFTPTDLLAARAEHGYTAPIAPRGYRLERERAAYPVVRTSDGRVVADTRQPPVYQASFESANGDGFEVFMQKVDGDFPAPANAQLVPGTRPYWWVVEQERSRLYLSFTGEGARRFYVVVQGEDPDWTPGPRMLNSLLDGLPAALTAPQPR